jgi:hypothetical protein
VRIYTVLLEEAPQGKIDALDPAQSRHQLRKRLERADLVNVPVIGGFEIVYRAKKRVGSCTSTSSLSAARKLLIRSSSSALTTVTWPGHHRSEAEGCPRATVVHIEPILLREESDGGIVNSRR